MSTADDPGVAGESGAWAAIVLAGSRKADDPVALARGVDQKCVVPVAGTAMLVRVVQTLVETPSIGRIAVVGDPAVLARFPALVALRDAGRLVAVPAAASPSRSVAAAIDVLGSWPVLVTTADHPLLTPALVQLFLDGATAVPGDLAAGLAPAEAILARFPESRRTWWRFRDGRFSGANLFALMTPKARLAVAFWRRVEEERKRPWRIARLFGWRHLAAYLLGRLTLEAAMLRASEAIGARVHAIPLAVAEAAIDVDKPEDLDLVERILSDRQRVSGTTGRVA